MTNYTDTQLKQALAKMLPEDLYQPKGDDDVCWSNASEKCHRDRRGYYVLDTELLHLCWLVEQTLNLEQRVDYSNTLGKLCGTEREKIYAGLGIKTIALAKVKGVEIV